MATRSVIAAKVDDGYLAIYCHWDGYLSWVGKNLHYHYTDELKVMALMSLGDLSSLEKEIGKKHTFDKPTAGWCVSYSRDRGEQDAGPKSFDSLGDLFGYARASNAEYVYLFDEGTWHVNIMCENDSNIGSFDLLEVHV